MSYVLQVTGRAGPPPHEDPIDWSRPVYLESVDIEAHNGVGLAQFTYDIAEALAWPTFTVAMEAWAAQSVTRPYRPDGRPNRPLTAYSVSPQERP